MKLPLNDLPKRDHMAIMKKSWGLIPSKKSNPSQSTKPASVQWLPGLQLITLAKLRVDSAFC